VSAANPGAVTAAAAMKRMTTAEPITDDGTPAAFYPYFYTTHIDGCTWGEGTDVPGLTVNDFGKLKQYGTYDRGVYYTDVGGGDGGVQRVHAHLLAQPVPRQGAHRRLIRVA
jgi:hypothetical protein